MLLWKIRACQCIINVEIILMYGISKINQLHLSSASQSFEKEVGDLLSERKVIFYEPPGIGSPLAFLVNETISFQNIC